MTKLERMAKAIYDVRPVWLGPPGSSTCPGKLTWEMLGDLTWLKRYGYGPHQKASIQRYRKEALQKAKAALKASMP